MKKSILLIAGIAITLLLIAAVITSIDDFFLPGSQIAQSGNLEHPDKCDNCHGGYDQAVEPAFNWRGSMMSQAARDPLFYACLAIAEQDAPGVGDLCLRCHTPDGWLNGRCEPTDGSALNNNDREGVQCDFCHKMVDPRAFTENPYPESSSYTSETWPQDKSYLAGIIPLPGSSANGMYIADANNAKRGPFDDATGRHKMFTSPFHSRSEHCGTCHDVSNPVFTRSGTSNPVYSPNEFGQQSPTFEVREMYPIERTYSEWKASGYATGADGVLLKSCQDCHMKDVTGKGAKMKNAPLRTNLPLHDMTGGNTFTPKLVKQLYPSEVDADALDAGMERARNNLQNAALLDLTLNSDKTEINVKVTNLTGHKLPTGYPEGRRMWINMKFFDSNGNLINQSGAYDFETGELDHDSNLKIYHCEPGISSGLANALGKPELEGPSFHMALNDMVYVDNRIPPAGFTNAMLIEYQSPVIGETYEDGNNFDETEYSIPTGSYKIEARLYYQTTSKEFIEFLRDENHTNNLGDDIYNLWLNHGKSTPVVMNEEIEFLTSTPNPPVAEYIGSPVSGEAPLKVQLTDLSTNATSWSWNFGDGGTSTAQHPSHEYLNAGTYTVSLTATNNEGSDTKTETDYISVTTPTSTHSIFVDHVEFTRHDAARGKTFVNAQITLVDENNVPVNGATVTGTFSGPTSGTDSKISNSEGIVTFPSNAVKKIRSEWCIDITSVDKTGYIFAGSPTWCESGTKSAFITQQDNRVQKLRVYPNPFSNRLRFEFGAPEDVHAKIDIYNMTGRMVETIFDNRIEGGTNYNAEFKPTSEVSAFYIYKMTLGDKVYNGRVIYKDE